MAIMRTSPSLWRWHDALQLQHGREVDLFPRSILKGNLPDELLKRLPASESVFRPNQHPDASAKLAGRLSQQQELLPQQPGVQDLLRVLIPACERWIRHVVDRQPPQGEAPGCRSLSPSDDRSG